MFAALSKSLATTHEEAIMALVPYTGPWYEEQDALRAEVLNPGGAAREAARLAKLQDGDKDWNVQCEVCESLPTVHPTGLCGACCFGEADTIGGNW